MLLAQTGVPIGLAVTGGRCKERRVQASIFISHAAEDRPRAIQVCAHLEGAGYRCWMAPRDVMPGRSYPAEIMRGLDEAKVVVLLLTRRANESHMVSREIERAVSRNRPVIPLRLEDHPMAGDLEFLLASTQWIDAWEPPFEAHLQTLLEVIPRYLSTGEQGASPVAEPPAPEPSRAPIPGISPDAAGDNAEAEPPKSGVLEELSPPQVSEAEQEVPSLAEPVSAVAAPHEGQQDGDARAEKDDRGPKEKDAEQKRRLAPRIMLVAAVAVLPVVSYFVFAPGHPEPRPPAAEKSASAEDAAPAGDMVEVPAGKFFMGCNEKVDDECDDDEKPGREVFVAAFEIDRTEVTVAQNRRHVDGRAVRQRG